MNRSLIASLANARPSSLNEEVNEGICDNGSRNLNGKQPVDIANVHPSSAKVPTSGFTGKDCPKCDPSKKRSGFVEEYDYEDENDVDESYADNQKKSEVRAARLENKRFNKGDFEGSKRAAEYAEKKSDNHWEAHHRDFKNRKGDWEESRKTSDLKRSKCEEAAEWLEANGYEVDEESIEALLYDWSLEEELEGYYPYYEDDDDSIVEIIRDHYQDESADSAEYAKLATLYPQFAKYFEEMSADEAKHAQFCKEMMNTAIEMSEEVESFNEAFQGGASDVPGNFRVGGVSSKANIRDTIRRMEREGRLTPAQTRKARKQQGIEEELTEGGGSRRTKADRQEAAYLERGKRDAAADAGVNHKKLKRTFLDSEEHGGSYYTHHAYETPRGKGDAKRNVHGQRQAALHSKIQARKLANEELEEGAKTQEMAYKYMEKHDKLADKARKAHDLNTVNDHIAKRNYADFIRQKDSGNYARSPKAYRDKLAAKATAKSIARHYRANEELEESAMSDFHLYQTERGLDPNKFAQRSPQEQMRIIKKFKGENPQRYKKSEEDDKKANCSEKCKG